MNIANKILVLLSLSLVLFSCGGTEPNPGDDPKIDTYPELVSACNRWAQGAGQIATGGRNAMVYHVTSLEDKKQYVYEQGTLRHALVQTGERIIVFDICGTIHLCAPLEINEKNGNVTILGQSAPGDGICIADYPLQVMGASNVILRFLRFRLGDTTAKLAKKDDDPEYDALEIRRSHRVIVDHCSMSWSIDECASCYDNDNLTMQYCIVSESLRNAGHPKGAHGYGGIWGGKNVTFHHNLLAHHDSRNPRFDHDYVSLMAGPIDYINNVVYDWGGNSTYGGEGSTKGGGARKINFVNNYYKPGPSSQHRARLLNPYASCSNCLSACHGTIVPPQVYLTGNYMFGSSTVTGDNWKGVDYSDGATESQVKVSKRYTFSNAYTDEQSAEDAYTTVLNLAGCSLSRDAVDARVVNDVLAQTGSLIDSQDQVGGWPILNVGTPLQDSDNDGMPDEWELKYGLDPNNMRDAFKSTLVSKYSNLEVYLNDKVIYLYANINK